LTTRNAELTALITAHEERIAFLSERNIFLAEQRVQLEADLAEAQANCSTIAAEGLYYLHADHLGRPQFATDPSGAIVWDMGEGVTPFGDSVNLAGALAQRLMFPGQYADVETSDPDTGDTVTLSHNWHRTYDPTLGRYLQSDPIGLAGGLNRYAYVGGNPVSYVDPMGLDGIFGIHSENPNSDSSTGHSWTSYTPLDSAGREACGCSETITFDAWPDSEWISTGIIVENDPRTALKIPSASRTRRIDNDVEKRFFSAVKRQQTRNGKFFDAREGAPLWAKVLGTPIETNYTVANPCSAWAAQAWNSVTGEKISSRNLFQISTPWHLSNAIKRSNKRDQRARK